MKKVRLSILLISLSFLGCSEFFYVPMHVSTTEEVTFYSNQGGNRINYQMIVPSNFIEYVIENDIGKEKCFSFPDESIIFITDRPNGKSEVNHENIEYLNVILLNEYNSYTHANLEGTQIDGRFWRQKKLGNTIVGYINVFPSQKQKYDSIIDSLKIETVRYTYGLYNITQGI